VYVVVGDSTGAGQGAPYEAGIAVQTARRLARTRSVRLVNLSVSGARTADVARFQARQAARLRPDLVLVAVGANDVIHLARRAKVRDSLDELIGALRSSRCDARVVLTGVPAMGAVPRFAPPLRWLAELAARRMNATWAEVARARGATLAPLARETAPLLRRDPTLFAEDGFHPDARGYAVWLPVLHRAIEDALARPAKGCSGPAGP
jgi:lysophospholipase L1-like esterase